MNKHTRKALRLINSEKARFKCKRRDVNTKWRFGRQEDVARNVT